MRTNIPAELKTLHQWVCARADKSPLDPKNGRNASVSDLSTWSTFNEAEGYAEANNLRIGFVLTSSDDYCIIDLDDKLEKPATEDQKTRFTKIIEEFDSYTELSTSGRGCHVVVKGSIPEGAKRDNVEVYSQGRFMIFTGDAVRDVPIANRQELLNKLYAEMKPSKQAAILPPQLPAIPDKDVLAKVRDCHDSFTFDALWAGDWGNLNIGDGSQSAADFKLGIMLAHFTSDEAQWMRLFRQSRLGERDKAKRDDYLARTFKLSRERVSDDGIQGSYEHGRAIAEVLLAKWHSSKKALSIGLLEPFCDFIQKQTTVLKLVKGILGEGGLSALYGAPGAGKSFLALDIGFAVATGRQFMAMDTRQGPVIYLVGEGVSGFRLRSKAIAKVKGDNSPPIFFLPHAISTPDETDKLVAMLEEVATRCGVAPVLLIIDTLSRFFGTGDDENSAKDMKRFVGAIGLLHAKYPSLHVMVIHHSGKDQDRGMRGSSALQGAADTVIQCRKNGDGHIAIVEKQKDGQDNIHLPFSLEQVELGVDEDGVMIATCVVADNHDSKPRPLSGYIGMAAKVLRYLKQSTLPDGVGNLKLLIADIPLQAFHNHMYLERPEDKPDTVRKNARRQLEKLNDMRLVEWDRKDGAIRLLPAFNNVSIE